MTDRLSALLHDEAERLDVPPPPAHDVLSRGRGLRRRRRTGRVVALGAALVLLASGATAVLDRTDERPTTVEDRSLTAAQAYAAGGAFSVGREIHFGVGEDHIVSVEGKVKALYYTSAGVVARTGPSPYTDAAGASRYALVTPDGDVRDLGIDLGDRVPATEAAAPYLAWATAGDGDRAWQVVVLDVRSGDEVARVDVAGTFTWGGWEAPPVGLSGDTVYVGFDDVTTKVDWPTARTSSSEVLPGGSIPSVSGGVGTVHDRGNGVVVAVDAEDGTVRLSVPDKGYPYVQVSPDGQWAKVVVQDAPASPDGETFSLHDLVTGEESDAEGAPWDYGWTPDGHLLKVTRRAVSVCDPVPFRCTDTAVDLGGGPIKVAGLSYES